MTDNLRLWTTFADIDPKFTKPITGKPYKGTSPNPQAVVMCLTEMFGPVGEGFGWKVLHEEFQPLGDEVLHWCRIQFWHTSPENSFESYGQTRALMKTKNGMMLDEDAPKKSLTDAIVKAASYVGVAANIFLGRWDDQKYVAQVAKDYAGNDGPKFDAIAARDRIKRKIERAESMDDLGHAWSEEREDIARLKAEDPPKFNEITAAKDAAKTRLTKEAA